MRAYTQSGQYHTIVESRVQLTWYSEPCPKTGKPKIMRTCAQSEKYHTIVESRI